MTIERSGGVSPTDQAADAALPFTPFDGALFISISFIWGASFLLIAEGLESLTPGMVTFGRVASGAAMLVALRLRPGAPRRSIDRTDWPRVLLVALVWIVIPFTLFPLAQEMINSALTGLLNGATPVFVSLFALFLSGARPHGNLMIGLVLGFAGVVTLSLPSLDQGNSEVKGVLMVLAATVCYGVAMNVAGPLQRRYGAVTLMTPILVISSVLLVPIGLRDFGDNVWRADAVIPILVLGVVGTGLAYWVMATLVGRVGAVRGSFITYLIPVISLVLGVVVRNDRVAALSLVGAAMTTAGALLASGRLRLPTKR